MMRTKACKRRRLERRRVRKKANKITDRELLRSVHWETPSRAWQPMIRNPDYHELHPTYRLPEEFWENNVYHANCVRFETDWPMGGGPWAIIGITANNQTALHDWRDFQRIKNDIVGPDWEGVELYPAESRLVDPSNRFYLWCVPKGVLRFGYDHRRIWGWRIAIAPQRPFAFEAHLAPGP